MPLIFITKTIPRTYIEDIRKKSSEKIAQELHLRDIQRCFPGLNINPVFQTEYYTGIESETYYFEKDKLLDCEISGDAHDLHIRYMKSEDYVLTKFMVVRKIRGASLIVWTRNLTLQEQEDGEIYENFQGMLDVQAIGKNVRHMIVFEYENKKNGEL